MADLPEQSHRAHENSWMAALLSYLVPGLGQIYQGRVAKGLLFMVCLYALFFYGMALGSGKIVTEEGVYYVYNVYLPDTSRLNNPWGLRPPLLANVYNRLQFAGQFWIGVAAWPAIYQYLNYDELHPQGSFLSSFERTPSESHINELQQQRDKTWDLGWVYTVIAGVLNILVIYDAFAGPAFAEAEREHPRLQQEAARA
jgi:TM2 domain-containing membrane protein YozV